MPISASSSSESGIVDEVQCVGSGQDAHGDERNDQRLFEPATDESGGCGQAQHEGRLDEHDLGRSAGADGREKRHVHVLASFGYDDVVVGGAAGRLAR